MAIFKNKTKKEEQIPDEKKDLLDKKKKETKPLEKSINKKDSIAWNFLKSPYVSEKATALSEENKYVFIVSDKANKSQVKESMQELYKVKVLNVNIVKIPRKKKRLGKYHGWKKGFKKAVIEVKKGEKIDIYPS
jgi:large subunit ribosomal protein L23